MGSSSDVDVYSGIDCRGVGAGEAGLDGYGEFAADVAAENRKLPTLGSNSWPWEDDRRARE